MPRPAYLFSTTVLAFFAVTLLEDMTLGMDRSSATTVPNQIRSSSIQRSPAPIKLLVI